NEVVVFGTTDSEDLPMTANAFSSVLNNGVLTLLSQYNDFFFAKFNSSGTQLLAATYLGGNRSEKNWSLYAQDNIVIDAQNNIWGAGFSSKHPDNPGTFPITPNALLDTLPTGSSGGAVLFHISGNLDTLLYSSYFAYYDTVNAILRGKG